MSTGQKRSIAPSWRKGPRNFAIRGKRTFTLRRSGARSLQAEFGHTDARAGITSPEEWVSRGVVQAEAHTSAAQPTPYTLWNISWNHDGTSRIIAQAAKSQPLLHWEYSALTFHGGVINVFHETFRER